jgi:hypothetical protein
VVITALGTVGSALFVGWQAWLTREVLKASKAAAEPARTAAIYAARAGMDTDAPKVQVFIDEATMPMFEPSASAHLGGQPQRLKPGREWHLPRDAGQRLLVRLVVRIANRGDSLADLSFDGCIRGPESTASETSIFPTPMDGSLGIPYFIDASFTIKEWSENWRARQQGKTLPFVAMAAITCTDIRDEGVVDTWSLQISSCPIRSDPERDGVWQIDPDLLGKPTQLALGYKRRPPRKRTYWRSRSENLPLANPFTVPEMRRRIRSWAGRGQGDSHS